jgi:hypothetical protein
MRPRWWPNCARGSRRPRARRRRRPAMCGSERRQSAVRDAKRHEPETRTRGAGCRAHDDVVRNGGLPDDGLSILSGTKRFRLDDKPDGRKRLHPSISQFRHGADDVAHGRNEAGPRNLDGDRLAPVQVRAEGGIQGRRPLRRSSMRKRKRRIRVLDHHLQCHDRMTVADR